MLDTSPQTAAAPRSISADDVIADWRLPFSLGQAVRALQLCGRPHMDAGERSAWLRRAAIQIDNQSRAAVPPRWNIETSIPADAVAGAWGLPVGASAALRLIEQAASGRGHFTAQLMAARDVLIGDVRS